MHKRIVDELTEDVSPDEPGCREGCNCSCKTPTTDRNPEALAADYESTFAGQERPQTG